MKIVVIGATGTIGSAVVRALGRNHDVLGASRQSDPPIDVEAPATVEAFFQAISNFDAVITCTGRAAFKPIAELTEADFSLSFNSKLLGQIRVLRAALARINDGGSITVTSGVLAREPMLGSGAVSLVNAGLEGFVRAAALEAPRGIRVNAVSPPWAKETLEKFRMDAAHSLSADQIANAYVAAVEGSHQGQVLDASRFV